MSPCTNVNADKRSAPRQGGAGRGALWIAIRWATEIAILPFCNVTITLNGEPFELSGPLTVTELLSQLDIDGRRVAVELNVVVLKRAAFDETIVREADQVEIVNFVGGG